MRYWKTVLGVGVLGLALGAGIAWATIPDSNGVIHTCFKNGSWRVIDSSLETCRSTETPLDVNPGAVHAVIRTETQSIPPGGEATFTAHCQAGEVATGGGWRVVGSVPAPVTVNGSIPQSSSPEPSAGETPIGWKVVGATNNDSVSRDVTVLAVCAPASP